MTLEEQIGSMVDDGAVLWFRNHVMREHLGLVVVEEAEEAAIFFCECGQKGPAMHIYFAGKRSQGKRTQVLFYRADGELKGVITRMREYLRDAQD